MTYKICAFCRFWQSEKAESAAASGQSAAESGGTENAGGEMPDRRAKVGLCRRAAPRPGAVSDMTQWPKTGQRDWCGDWEGRDIEYRSQTQRPPGIIG